MAGCGYVCPVCEGRGFLEDGSDCDFCRRPKSIAVAVLAGNAAASRDAICTAGGPRDPPNNSDADREAWIAQVHQGSCCADTSKR